MLSIAMFNNKGGVGKTTLTNNIASFLAESRQKRVLVVDCDPQCNTTQLLMGEEYATKLYWGTADKPNVTTISDILAPIESGDSHINGEIIPIKSSETRFNVDLIPGNPKFSVIEDRLGAAWHELKGYDIGGIRKTNWNTFMLEKLKNNYDFIFFDLGPSLGSINRSVLIGCDYFITPMGTDIFSILGIKNISEWISSWIGIYNNSIKQSSELEPGKLENFKIPKQLKITNGYIGYTIQQYITKSFGGVRRPTRAYEQIINNVPDQIQASLGKFFSDKVSLNELKLGDVPHLYSLIPLAQSNSCPLLKLKGSDGLVGTQFKQLEDYKIILEGIVTNLLRNINNQ